MERKLAGLPLLAAAATLAFFGSASAFLSTAMVSAPDPYTMVESSIALGNGNVVGKTLVTGAIGSPTVLLIAGQSNSANAFPTPYTPINSTLVFNLNPYDGAIYYAADPLLGCSTPTPAGNFAGRLADKLIAAGTSTSVMIVTVSVDGSAVQEWTSPSNYGSRLTTALRRLSARGLTPAAILWGQGEANAGMAQATYQTNIGTWVGNVRAAGYAGPIFIAKQTWNAGVVDANIQAAQLAVVNHGSGIWAGADGDSLNATNRQVDNTHFNDTGADAYATLWRTALHAYGAPF